MNLKGERWHMSDLLHGNVHLVMFWEWKFPLPLASSLVKNAIVVLHSLFNSCADILSGFS